MSITCNNDAIGSRAEAHDDEVRFGRFHQSGANPLTDRGLDLLSMPTVTAQRLGVEHLASAHMAGDRLATCVLGMCALEGIGIMPDERAGLRLLEGAADMGSHRAENYLARYLLSRWEDPATASTSGLGAKGRASAEKARARSAIDHRQETRRVWKYLRGPILRGDVTEAGYPAIRSVFDEIVWRSEVTDDVELDVCMVLGSRGDAHATYLAGLAYERGVAGVHSLDVAYRLMCRSMRSGHHDALMWVRFARRSGLVA